MKNLGIVNLALGLSVFLTQEASALNRICFFDPGDCPKGNQTACTYYPWTMADLTCEDPQDSSQASSQFSSPFLDQTSGQLSAAQPGCAYPAGSCESFYICHHQWPPPNCFSAESEGDQQPDETQSDAGFGR